jgi:hypothetical protein
VISCTVRNISGDGANLWPQSASAGAPFAFISTRRARSSICMTTTQAVAKAVSQQLI